MNSRLIISLLCAGAFALACGSLTRHEDADAHASRTTAHVASALNVVDVPRHSQARKRHDDVPRVNGKFDVKVEPHTLHFALKLTNDSKSNVELSFPNGQQYEFTVLDSVGREVYRWGEGRMFTQSVQNKQIDGDQTMRIDESAAMTLPHGKYVAVATLRSSNFPMKQSSAFELR
ncbi:MAG: BsuPI-related putative proteinase inhibitor [bacterium]